MIEKIFDSETFLALKKALDAATLRQQTIANNIANVDTPGYKRADVTFEEELKAALSSEEKLPMTTTHPRHISSKPKSVREVKPRIIQQNDTVFRNDLNNVDIDEEMAKLTENNLAYNTIAQLISDKLRAIREVASEGRR